MLNVKSSKVWHFLKFFLHTTYILLNYCSIYSVQIQQETILQNLAGFIELNNRSHKHNIGSTFLHIIIKSDHWPIIRIVLLFLRLNTKFKKGHIFLHLIAKEFNCITVVRKTQIPCIVTLCDIRIIFSVAKQKFSYVFQLNDK